MRISIKYKNYPLSEELTKKSHRVGAMTHPLNSIFLGAVLMIASSVLVPSSPTLPMILLFVGIVAGLVLLPIYRKKKFAQFDAEYERILPSKAK